MAEKKVKKEKPAASPPVESRFERRARKDAEAAANKPASEYGPDSTEARAERKAKAAAAQA